MIYRYRWTRVVVLAVLHAWLVPQLRAFHAQQTDVEVWGSESKDGVDKSVRYYSCDIQGPLAILYSRICSFDLEFLICTYPD